MKNFILIDGGSHHGETIDNFYNSKVKNKEKFIIHSFEADPRNYNVLQNNIKKYNNKNIKIYNSALSNSKLEKLKLFICKTPNQSSSIIKEKKTGNLNDNVFVNNIYFKDFIEKKFKKNDYIILKLDIEGAEYEIFDCIEKHNLYSYFDMLLVEFHNVKVGIKKEVDKIIMDRFKKHKIHIINEKEVSNFTTGNWFDYI